MSEAVAFAVACKDRNAQWQSMFDACGGGAA